MSWDTEGTGEGLHLGLPLQDAAASFLNSKTYGEFMFVELLLHSLNWVDRHCLPLTHNQLFFLNKSMAGRFILKLSTFKSTEKAYSEGMAN